MTNGSREIHQIASTEIFDHTSPSFSIECIRSSANPSTLTLHSFDGKRYEISPSIKRNGRTYTAPRADMGLIQSIRFPVASEPFGSSDRLVASILELMSRYCPLLPDAADMVAAFAIGSWFVDCLPVAPLLYLLGPDNEVSLLFRLLGCVCRRSALLSDLDVAALRTLPRNLNPTLLIKQRSLGPRIRRVLMASNTRYFHLAHGKGDVHAYGAKAISVDPEFENESGIRVSLTPAYNPMPSLTDAAEVKIAHDFQAKLLRYRMIQYGEVCKFHIATPEFVPGMREEAHTWLAPIFDCAALTESVSRSLLQVSREAESNRLSDDRCLVAEAALFFCHKQETTQFFIGDLADAVNALLKGRHEDRELTPKKVGLLLRSLGIHGQRVVNGYRIELTDPVREQIHHVALAHQVPSAKDAIARCLHCRVFH